MYTCVYYQLLHANYLFLTFSELIKNNQQRSRQKMLEHIDLTFLFIECIYSNVPQS